MLSRSAETVLDWLPLDKGVPAVSGLPLGIDCSVPVSDYSFATRTVAQLNTRTAFWTKHGLVGGQPAPERLTPVTYRQVAAEIGVAYIPTFGNEAIQRAYGGWPPHLGSSLELEVAFAQQLVAVLGPQTDAYFFGSVDEGNYRWEAQGLSTD